MNGNFLKIVNKDYTAGVGEKVICLHGRYLALANAEEYINYNKGYKVYEEAIKTLNNNDDKSFRYLGSKIFGVVPYGKKNLEDFQKKRLDYSLELTSMSFSQQLNFCGINISYKDFLDQYRKECGSIMERFCNTIWDIANPNSYNVHEMVETFVKAWLRELASMTDLFAKLMCKAGKKTVGICFDGYKFDFNNFNRVDEIIDKLYYSELSDDEKLDLYCELISYNPYATNGSFYADITKKFGDKDHVMFDLISYITSESWARSYQNDIERFVDAQYNSNIPSTKDEFEKLRAELESKLNYYGVSSSYRLRKIDKVIKAFGEGQEKAEKQISKYYDIADKEYSKVIERNALGAGREERLEPGTEKALKIVGTIIGIVILVVGFILLKNCVSGCASCVTNKIDETTSSSSTNSKSSTTGYLSKSSSTSSSTKSSSQSTYSTSSTILDSTETSSSSFETSLESEISAPSESVLYDENDVINAVNELFTLIKKGDAVNADKHIIDDDKLRGILVLFTPEFRRSAGYMSSEIIGICSGFQLNVKTPTIDQNAGTASVDVTFNVPDYDAIVAKTQLIASDILTYSGNVVAPDDAVELNIQVMSYIESTYNVSLTDGYPEETLFDIALGGTLGCCYGKGMFDNIAPVSKTHTLTFIYRDDEWKLSGCDDLSELMFTLMGDMDKSLYE